MATSTTSVTSANATASRLTSFRHTVGQQIVNWEARRDAQGLIEVYGLPADDGGGAWEVAGINVADDTPVAKILRELIENQKQAVAESIACIYIAQNTDNAHSYNQVPAIEATLRDIIFNRGDGGLVKTLQIACGVTMDGDFGPLSQAALEKKAADVSTFLQTLRDARETYEKDVVGYRANFWAGLTNRWNNCLAFSQTFVSSMPSF